MFGLLKKWFGPDNRERTEDFKIYLSFRRSNPRDGKKSDRDLLLEYMREFSKSPFVGDKQGREAKKFWDECNPPR